MSPKQRRSRRPHSSENYAGFYTIDGNHPLKSLLPDGVVTYPVRMRQGGRVSYLNFQLAQDMGLISQDHPHQLSRNLEKAILDNFSLLIINEYDEVHKRQFPASSIKPNRYMATRYLQLQHRSRTGKTSGDGRSIWNGIWKGRGRVWDITSCGTGVTCLSPGMVEANKPLRSGSNDFSYGNGMAETAEGLEGAILSEILHRHGLATERVLAVITFRNGTAIHVRAAQNLIRPSHIFLHLKQGNHTTLKTLVDYVIGREKSNDRLDPESERSPYRALLQNVAQDMSRAAAMFEDEYIFHWMDWDGDNLLLNGGILDYGSVRQFGLFHHQYRYDDIDRYSTSITEQKIKARYIVQTFVQAMDFVATGTKRPIEDFAKHEAIEWFEASFEETKNRNLLRKCGFSRAEIRTLLRDYEPFVVAFRRVFRVFERTTTARGPIVVADGINRNAVYCMRDLLRELPRHYLKKCSFIRPDIFLKLMKSRFADRQAARLTKRREQLITEFQQLYWDLVASAAIEGGDSLKKVLLEMTMRSSLTNRYDRITGNALIAIVEKFKRVLPKMTKSSFIQSIENFVAYQALPPSRQTPSSTRKKLMSSLRRIVKIYRHDI